MKDIRLLVRNEVEGLIVKECIDSLVASIVVEAPNIKKSIHSNQIRKPQNEGVVNEVVASALISLILSAPRLLIIIGKSVKKVSAMIRSVFGKKQLDNSNTSNAFIQWGHKLEHIYIGILKKTLTLTGIAKKANITTDEDLEKAAVVLYYTMIFAAAIAAGVATYESITSILDGTTAVVSTGLYGTFKGAMTTVKADELIKVIKKVI